MTEPGGAESAGKFRTHSGPMRGMVEVLLASLTLLGAAWALQVQNLIGGMIFSQQYLALVLGLGLVCIFLGAKARAGEPDGRAVPWYDWLAAAASVAACGYLVVRYPVLVGDIGALTPERWALGAVAVVLALEATRRMVGWTLVWIAVIVIVYARVSDLLPGVLNAPGSDWRSIAAYLYLDGNAILGLPLTVFSNIIIAFILFGYVLYALNADKVLTATALAVMGRRRGGPAKVAVGGSSLFGTISGSVVSNVMMDGPVTIPMMVRTGYRPHVAAAIEAVASNGGQILPPVMGITAFLIADWLNVPYAEVVIAALFPAVLYYVALFVQVDLEAARNGLVGLPASQLPPIGPVLRQGWVFVLPLAVLVYTLLVANWQPGRAAMAAVITALAVGLLRRETRPTPKAVWNALLGTGRTLLDLVAIVATAGIIIGAMQLSGLAFSLSLVLVTLAAGSLLLLLFLAALLSVVLGMGLPTAVIYILLAVLVAPGLVEFGVPQLAAHLFIFYFGTMSAITPPLCFATFAAAAIAGCDFWKAGWAGVRLAFVAYVIPFFFVFQPELLFIGSPAAIALAMTTSAVGVVFIAAGFAGYLFAPLSLGRRVALAVGGFCLIPSPAGGLAMIAINVAGGALALLVALDQRRRARRFAASPEGVEENA